MPLTFFGCRIKLIRCESPRFLEQLRLFVVIRKAPFCREEDPKHGVAIFQARVEYLVILVVLEIGGLEGGFFRRSAILSLPLVPLARAILALLLALRLALLILLLLLLLALGGC